MNTYAKLKNGLLSYAPNGITEGYKPLIPTAAPSGYHIKSYDETDDAITVVWVAPNLETLKAIKKAEAQAQLDAAIAATTTLEVEGVGSVIYDQTVAVTLLTLESYDLSAMAVSYTLADDSVIDAITAEQVAAIKLAGMAQVTALYEVKRAKVAAIETAESTEELLEL